MASMFTLLTAVLVAALCRSTLAASSDDWRGRTIYQVMTDRFALESGSTSATCDTSKGDYCGGNWQGLINKLDYIQDMGFDAVWISPVTKQMEGLTSDGAAYHGYWQQDLYNVNSHFGQTADLKSLASELHSRGMYLMVDIVTNHLAWNGDASTINYANFNPFHQQSYFHDKCAIDYNNIADTQNLEQCWEGSNNVPLPDLRTEDQDIQDMFSSWITQFVSEFSIDGLRIDSVLEVDTGFWSGFQSAAGMYSVGEAFNSDTGFVCNFQNYLPGVMNYGTYFPLVTAFTNNSGSISDLADSINAVKSDCADTTLLGSFSENHDVPRFASLTGDLSLAKNVLAYTMLADGIPIVYQGQEQHYNSQGGSGVPYNREALWLSGYNTDAPLYGLVKTLNAARRNAMDNDASYLTYQNYPIHTDGNNIALRKGHMVTVLSNLGSNGDAWTLNLDSGYDAGTQVTELLTCQTLTADSNGKLAVPMANGLPRVYYPTSSTQFSGLCGTSKFKPRQASKYWAPISQKL